MKDPWIARRNRRGCFIIVTAILLVIAAIAYLGFSGEPIDRGQTEIPVTG